MLQHARHDFHKKQLTLRGTLADDDESVVKTAVVDFANCCAMLMSVYFPFEAFNRPKPKHVVSDWILSHENNIIGDLWRLEMAEIKWICRRLEWGIETY
jgi:hypothetical protein